MRLSQITEARYATPESLAVYGVLFVNPLHLDDPSIQHSMDYIKQRDVKIWFDIEKQVDMKNGIMYYGDVTKVKAPPESLAKQIVKKGESVMYQRDEHGWMLVDDQHVWALQAQ